jgi:uncharacterized protein (TIGR02611 family)
VKDLVRLLRRIAVTVAGIVILAVGVVLLVAPGPGLLVIALALAVFAIEYRWARRHLAAVQARARSAALKTAASRVATASAVLELLSRPVDQDLLGCVFLPLLAGSLDEFAVDEGRSSADQGDEVGGVDGAPAVLR